MILIHIMDDVCYPERAHFTDAGLDLKTSETVTLQPGDVEKVGTAIKVEIPPGHVGLIFPRSGLASKKGIVLRNTVGVIDSDYRGEIICGLHNQGSFEYTVEYGERIAQMVVVPCLIGDFLEVEHNQLSNTERGEGGFGHTG